MIQVARAYPQQDTLLLGDSLSWNYMTPIWISRSSVKFGDDGNWDDVLDDVDDYLDPDGNTFGVALVDNFIRDTSNSIIGTGGSGWDTVIAVNGDGFGGEDILHELMHAWGFVDDDASNYFPNQDDGADNHSKYNEGQWSDPANCVVSRLYRQALKDETGATRRVVHMDDATTVDLPLSPCGSNSIAKSIMAYAPSRNNSNTLLEPVDYEGALAQLCIGFSGFQLYSKCPGYSVPPGFPFLAGQHAPAAPQLSPLGVSVPTRTLRLSGRIDASDRVTTSVSYVASNDGALTPQTPGGAYHLIVRAADNSVLHNQAFNVPLGDEGPHPEPLAPASAASTLAFGRFHLRVPFPLNATKAEIRHNNVVIWQWSVSANAPTVSFVTPNGGTFNAANPIHVSWTASDTDGDPLQFGLDYSPDNGATWLSLSTKLLGTSFDWTPNFVPPGASARLRLRASDGFNSTVALSNPFTLTPRAPKALILSPHSGVTVTEGALVNLDGSSQTANGIGLGSFTWRQDGAIVGLTRTVTTTLNTLGVHTITLQVAANALVGTSAVTVSVSADYDHDGMPNDWELLYALNPLDPADALNDPDGDGLTNIAEYHNGTNPRVADTDGDGVNDGAEVGAGYDPGKSSSKPPATPVLDVGALSLGFQALQGWIAPGAKSTWVSNGGGGALSWTAASDVPWLSATPGSGGNGPTQLNIRPNSGILASGVYTGHVTVTAAGAANSPHIIAVRVEVAPFPGPRTYLPLIER
jgi:hypothetical protein